MQQIGISLNNIVSDNYKCSAPNGKEVREKLVAHLSLSGFEQISEFDFVKGNQGFRVTTPKNLPEMTFGIAVRPFRISS